MNDTELRDLILSSIRDVIEDPRRFGLVWRRLPATVEDGSDPGAVLVVMDGDTDPVTAVSLIGSVSGRVMVDVVPPSGMYVIGRIAAAGVYAFAQTVPFAASGTFTVSDYAGLSAVRVRMVGGGGAGGGAAASAASNASIGGGGGGGGYAESWIPVESLSGDAITVTIGAGGTGVAGGSGNAGTDSSFDGLLVVADGGLGGAARPSGTAAFGIPGSAGGTTSTGDLTIPGGGGGSGWADGQLGISGTGGASQLSGSAIGVRTVTAGESLAGTAGLVYGGGGAGAATSGGGAAAAGGAGADGIVLVDVYV